MAMAKAIMKVILTNGPRSLPPGLWKSHEGSGASSLGTHVIGAQKR